MSPNAPAAADPSSCRRIGAMTKILIAGNWTPPKKGQNMDENKYFAAVSTVCTNCLEKDDDRCEKCPVRQTVNTMQKKCKLRFRFYKQIEFEDELTPDEVNHIAKDGFPPRIWERAKKGDSLVPIEFGHFDFVDEED